MTSEQQTRLAQLQQELLARRGIADCLPNLGESDGYVFTEVQGVIIVITRVIRNERGGYKVPALRSYPEVGDPTNSDAAIQADVLFARQRTRDASDLDRARLRGHGHLGPVVGLDWRGNNELCGCRGQDLPDDRKQRSLT
jgi:hypothetical protein